MKNAKMIARLALLTALALILGYVESLLPIVPSAPGIKIGLSNLVVLYAIWQLGSWQAFVLMLLKVGLSGLLFSGPVGALYALAGGILSVIGMVLLHRANLSVVAVSAAGGVLHNIGQTAIACALLSPAAALGYLPVLLAAGLLAGLLLGLVSQVAIRAIDRYERGKHA